jgi:hypothetical protein
MELKQFLPGIFCVVTALLIMVRLMHYARFYGPSYFLWIGIILAVVGLISLIKPLAFLFILNRTMALTVFGGGLLTITASLFWPVQLIKAHTGNVIDQLAPEYASNEYHERIINASPSTIKDAFRITGVGDIPIVHLLMKIRGIAEEKDMSDEASKTEFETGILRTPDFDWIVVDSIECITFMIMNVSTKTPPPILKTIEQFNAFNEPGYNKVAVNFRFKPLGNGQTLVSTETRNFAPVASDNQRFARYWRVIYPGSALIRRVWLDTLAKKAEQMEQVKNNKQGTTTN